MRSKFLLFFLGVALIGAAALLITKKSKRRGEDERKIVLYNWSNYIDPDVLGEFTKETGISVVEEIYDSNETLRAKLLAGADGYDVIVPSGVMVSTLIREGLIDKIDLSKIPNLKHLDPFFRGLYFDPKDEYSVPYLWGSTGIGYRKDLVAPAPDSWAALFDPKLIAKYKGKLSVLDDPRETVSAALQYLGYSINSTDPMEIDAAVKVLLLQKPFLSRYDSEVYNDFLVAGDTLVAHGWSGTLNKAIQKNPNIAYVVPKEGGIMGVDCLTIPKSSKNKEAAYKLIDFIMRPAINARIVNKTSYPSANKAAQEFIDKSILSNPSIYPPRAAIEKMEWLKDVGVHSDLYEKAWEKVRLAN